MAEHPRTSREFASAPPHADAGTRQWISSLLPVLQRGYMNIRKISADTNIDRDDSVLMCNTGSNSITVTLPPVDQVTGKVYYFKKTASSNTLTIDPHGSELIDGASTGPSFSNLRSGVGIVSNGTAWESIPVDYLNTANMFTQDQTIGDGTEVAARLILDAQVKQIRFNKGGELRWIIQVSDDDDDGDNDGGDLTFVSRDDSGGNIGTALEFERSSMNATLGGNLNVDGGWLFLHSKTTGSQCRLSFHNQSTLRWNLFMLQNTFDNSLNFLCYDNAGNQDKYVLTMDRLLYSLSIGNGSLDPNYQNGSGVLRIGNRYAAPTGNASGGGFLYAESGALKWRGSSGTVTTIANA